MGWQLDKKTAKKVGGQISLVNFLPYLGHSKISEKFIRLERFEIWKPKEGVGLEITVSLEYHPTVWLLRRPLWRWYCTINHFHGINKTGIMFMWVDLHQVLGMFGVHYQSIYTSINLTLLHIFSLPFHLRYAVWPSAKASSSNKQFQPKLSVQYETF